MEGCALWRESRPAFLWTQILKAFSPNLDFRFVKRTRQIWISSQALDQGGWRSVLSKTTSNIVNGLTPAQKPLKLPCGWWFPSCL